MRVFTSRRGVPFFKSMSIKCQWCNVIFWAVQVTAVLSGTSTWRLEQNTHNSFYLIERSDLLFSACNGFFCIQLTLVSWKETIEIPSSIGDNSLYVTHWWLCFSPLTQPFWGHRVNSKVNIWLIFPFTQIRQFWYIPVALVFKLRCKNLVQNFPSSHLCDIILWANPLAFSDAQIALKEDRREN